MLLSDLKSRLIAATKISEVSAKVALVHFRNSPTIETKADQSPVTIANAQTEQIIRDGLLHAFPDDGIFGEEYGRSGDSTNIWIIDPIDGTRSFIIGLPLFGMLLGFVNAHGSQLGIIRMPALNEVYSGAVGLGANCNGDPIAFGACIQLTNTRLFINEVDKLAVHESQLFSRLVQSSELRRTGVDCYPLALVARGLVDAMVYYELKPYDYLPVSAVVDAAGGIMTDCRATH